MKPSKFTKKVIEILTAEEIDKVLSSMNPDTVLGAMNIAMVTLMPDTGLRRSEVIRLDPADVHLEDWYLMLGKGNKGTGGGLRGELPVIPHTLCVPLQVRGGSLPRRRIFLGHRQLPYGERSP